MLSESNKKFLLKLARQILVGHFKNKDYQPLPSEIPVGLQEKQGIFVTLRKNGALRGCIGYLEPEKELWQAVKDNVINAAFHDWRFSPLEKNELPQIEIEISVLTRPEPIQFASPLDLMARLERERPGVILKYGQYQATFLPQVWEQLPRAEEFLNHLALKAGLNLDKIFRGEGQFLIYTAEVFSKKSR